MPQVIDDPYGGNIFGRIGSGIGKGLSEQVPKEIERSRLSGGLKKLGEDAKMGKMVSPFDQAAQLLGTPGATPQMVDALLPLLRNQQAREEAMRRAQGTPREMAPGIGTAPQPAASEAVSRRTQPNYLQRSTPQQIQQETARLLNTFPNLYPTESEARAEAEKIDARRLAVDQDLEGKRELTKKFFEEQLETVLQKTGQNVFNEIPGGAKMRFLKDAQADVERGMTPFEAASKAAEDAKNLADAKLRIQAEGRKSFLGKERNRTREIIKSAQKEFSKGGAEQLKDFKNLIKKEHDLSEYEAASLAYPVEQNEKLYGELESLPSIKRKRGQFETPKMKKRAKDSAIQIAQQTAKSLAPNDSIYSIANFLEQKGYSRDAFVDEVRRLHNEGKLELNPRQTEEVLSSPNFISTLGDLYFKAFGG